MRCQKSTIPVDFTLEVDDETGGHRKIPVKEVEGLSEQFASAKRSGTASLSQTAVQQHGGIAALEQQTLQSASTLMVHAGEPPSAGEPLCPVPETLEAVADEPAPEKATKSAKRRLARATLERWNCTRDINTSRARPVVDAVASRQGSWEPAPPSPPRWSCEQPPPPNSPCQAAVRLSGRRGGLKVQRWHL